MYRKLFLPGIDFRTNWIKTLFLSKQLPNNSHTKLYSEFCFAVSSFYNYCYFD